jgi:hypothetical protein
MRSRLARPRHLLSASSRFNFVPLHPHRCCQRLRPQICPHTADNTLQITTPRLWPTPGLPGRRSMLPPALRAHGQLPLGRRLPGGPRAGRPTSPHRCLLETTAEGVMITKRTTTKAEPRSHHRYYSQYAAERLAQSGNGHGQVSSLCCSSALSLSL